MTLTPEHWPPGARWTVRVLAILVGITAGTVIALAAADSRIDTRSRVQAEAVVAPVAQKLDVHIAIQSRTEDALTNWLEEEREARKQAAKKLDALCRANPQAKCPLGQ
jgi:hypothetical protein